ncbi:MAG TPA: hypothetical protein VF634_03045 [Pyrinomonadaceae bacterium]|jgi:hypothetical protein
MKFLLIGGLSALLIFTGVVQGQQNARNVSEQLVKAELSEIKDKRRVYINADMPRQAENISKALKKEPGFELVGDVAQAEIVIVYKVEWEKSGISIGIASGLPETSSPEFGRMWIYLPQKSGPNLLVWENRMRYQAVLAAKGWEQPLEKTAISKFIKAVKKVRGEK